MATAGRLATPGGVYFFDAMVRIRRFRKTSEFWPASFTCRQMCDIMVSEEETVQDPKRVLGRGEGAGTAWRHKIVHHRPLGSVLPAGFVLDPRVMAVAQMAEVIERGTPW